MTATKTRSFRRPSRIPERGDVIWLDFSPQAGREQAARRPALVLSPAAYNGKVGLAVVCPITNQAKGYPFEVTIPKGFTATGVVLSDQIKSLDWNARKAEFKGTLSEELVKEVLENAFTLLDPGDEALEG